MEGYTPIFISSFMWFSLFLLSIFLCMLVRILSSKIYLLWFLLDSFPIAFIYYLYMVLEHHFDQVLQSWGVHPVSYPSVKKSLFSLQYFLLVCFVGCREYLLEHINKFNMDSKFSLLSPFNYADWKPKMSAYLKRQCLFDVSNGALSEPTLMKRRLIG